jgi:hypothetical protein
MTVKDLIETLQEFDPGTKVFMVVGNECQPIRSIYEDRAGKRFFSCDLPLSIDVDTTIVTIDYLNKGL